MDQLIYNEHIYLATDKGIIYSADNGMTWKIAVIKKTRDDEKIPHDNFNKGSANISVCSIKQAHHHFFCFTSSGKVYVTDTLFSKFSLFHDFGYGVFNANLGEVDPNQLLIQCDNSPKYLIDVTDKNHDKEVNVFRGISNWARFYQVGNDILLHTARQATVFIYNQKNNSFEIYFDEPDDKRKANMFFDIAGKRLLFSNKGVYMSN